MSAATMNEMERLRRERDEARAERDALAAHIANSNADKLTAAHNIREKCTGDAHLLGVADMLERSAGEAPTTSLARLKAEIRWHESDLAVVTLRRSEGRQKAMDALRSRAEHLRRQAEEPTNGHN